MLSAWAGDLPSLPRRREARPEHSPESRLRGNDGRGGRRCPSSVLRTGPQRTDSKPDPARAASGPLSAASVSDWQTRLKETDPKARHSPEFVADVIQLLNDERAPGSLRKQAAMLLARIGEPARAGVPALALKLDGPERPWAMKALGLFGETAGSVVPRLAGELRDPRQSVNECVLIADVLGQIGTAAAIQSLGGQLSRESAHPQSERALVRVTILDALSLSGPRAIAALPAVLRTMEDPKSEVRRSACQTIGALGPRAESALDALLERLVLDDSADVQDAAASAMARLGAVAVEPLMRVVADAPDDLKWRAARALGQIRPPAGNAVAVLQTQFENGSALVRLESLEAVFRITGQGGPVAGPLIEELSSRDRQAIMQATRLLVELPRLSPQATKKLEELAESAQGRVGRFAREVLRKRKLAGR